MRLRGLLQQRRRSAQKQRLVGFGEVRRASRPVAAWFFSVFFKRGPASSACLHPVLVVAVFGSVSPERRGREQTPSARVALCQASASLSSPS